METLPYLISFFEQVDVLMLILVRVLAFFIFVPVLSAMTIPMQVRLLLAFFLSTAIFSSGLVTQATFHDSVAGFFVLMLTEFMAGALMGFVLFFMFNIILFAGQFMDFSMGFAMVNVLDPIQQVQVPIIGNVLFMSVSVLFVINGGLNEVLFVFVRSYDILPMGTAYIIGNVELASFIVGTLLAFVTLAIRIAIPLVGTMLIIDICLGIMVKSVPQMNVFVVGMPLKILIGTFLMFSVIIPSLGWIYNLIFDPAFDALIDMIWGMAPYDG